VDPFRVVDERQRFDRAPEQLGIPGYLEADGRQGREEALPVRGEPEGADQASGAAGLRRGQAEELAEINRFVPGDVPAPQGRALPDEPGGADHVLQPGLAELDEGALPGDGHRGEIADGQVAVAGRRVPEIFGDVVGRVDGRGGDEPALLLHEGLHLGDRKPTLALGT
jgi:hypothetical protein